MFKFMKGILSALAVATLLTLSAAATYAQTTGSVTMTATVSNFVELTSGGAVTRASSVAGTSSQNRSRCHGYAGRATT